MDQDVEQTFDPSELLGRYREEIGEELGVLEAFGQQL